MATGQHIEMLRFLAVYFFIVAQPSFALAVTDQASLCESAAQAVATESGIPEDIFRALTVTETGRSKDGFMRPWPWAMNHEGEGHWFRSKADLLDYAQALISMGETRFDIGCFQLNYRWHGQNFSSLDDMADPTLNARYAASFLLSKWRETGDWAMAVGAYHSNTQTHATNYLNRFWSVYGQLGPAGRHNPPIGAQAAEPALNHPNQFPLLISGRQSNGPSLVPITETRQPILGEH